jgi:hypothetical protein
MELKEKALLTLFTTESGENPLNRKRIVGRQAAKSPRPTSIMSQYSVPVIVTRRTISNPKCFS